MTFQQSRGGEESKPKSKTPLPFYYDDDFSCAITNPVRSSRERNRGRKTLEQYAEEKQPGKRQHKERSAPRLLHMSLGNAAAPGCF